MLVLNKTNGTFKWVVGVIVGSVGLMYGLGFRDLGLGLSKCSIFKRVEF